jgi:hypothetical protein
MLGVTTHECLADSQHRHLLGLPVHCPLGRLSTSLAASCGLQPERLELEIRIGDAEHVGCEDVLSVLFTIEVAASGSPTRWVSTRSSSSSSSSSSSGSAVPATHMGVGASTRYTPMTSCRRQSSAVCPFRLSRVRLILDRSTRDSPSSSSHSRPGVVSNDTPILRNWEQSGAGCLRGTRRPASQK